MNWWQSLIVTLISTIITLIGTLFILWLIEKRKENQQKKKDEEFYEEFINIVSKRVEFYILKYTLGDSNNVWTVHLNADSIKGLYSLIEPFWLQYNDKILDNLLNLHINSLRSVYLDIVNREANNDYSSSNGWNRTQKDCLIYILKTFYKGPIFDKETNYSLTINMIPAGEVIFTEGNK